MSLNNFDTNNQPLFETESEFFNSLDNSEKERILKEKQAKGIQKYLSNFNFNINVPILFTNDCATDGKSIFLPNSLLGNNFDRAEVLALINHELGHVIHSRDIFVEPQDMSKAYQDLHEYINCVDDARLDLLTRKRPFFVSAYNCTKYELEKISKSSLEKIKAKDLVKIEHKLLICLTFLYMSYTRIYKDEDMPNLKEIYNLYLKLLKNACKKTDQSVNLYETTLNSIEKVCIELENKFDDHTGKISIELAHSLLEVFDTFNRSKGVKTNSSSMKTKDGKTSKEAKDNTSKSQSNGVFSIKKSCSKDYLDEKIKTSDSNTYNSSFTQDASTESEQEDQNTTSCNTIKSARTLSLPDSSMKSNCLNDCYKTIYNELADNNYYRSRYILDLDGLNSVESATSQIVKTITPVNHDREYFNRFYSSLSVDDWNDILCRAQQSKGYRKVYNLCEEALSTFSNKVYTKPAQFGFRLSQHSLRKIALGQNPKKPFLKKSEKQTQDTEIVICIDISASMNLHDKHLKMQQAIALLTKAFENISNDKLDVSLLVFDNEAQWCCQGLDNFTFTKIKDYPKKVHGGTLFTKPLALANEKLLSSNKKRKVILFFTDGECDSREVPLADSFTKVIRKKGIEIYGLAYGFLANPKDYSIEDGKFVVKDSRTHKLHALPSFNSWTFVESDKVSPGVALIDFFRTIIKQSVND